MDIYKPEQPTVTELKELAVYLAKVFGTDQDIQMDNLGSAFIAKFPGYTTDGPGFVGTVYSIVWTSSPDMFDVVIKMSDGSLQMMEKQ